MQPFVQSAERVMRRTKLAEVYRKTGHLRVVQFLFGHTKVDRAARHQGGELEDVVGIAERIDILQA